MQADVYIECIFSFVHYSLKMKLFITRYWRNSTDRAAAAGSSKIFLILGISAIVGITVGIVALALGLGLGFGLSNNASVPTLPLLDPPIVVCDPSARCGCQTNRPVFTPRIINGQIATTNSWPWMVYIVTNNIRFCSGFLISQRHILTAASCVNPLGLNVSVTLATNNFQINVGSTNVSNSTVLSITSVADIAIITLPFNVTFNATVQPCCLTTSSSVPVLNTPGVIAGWGETSTSSVGIPAPTLQQAVVQVLNPSACGAQTNETICAGFGSISACPIDSGGPLMVSNNNAWTCVGVLNDGPPGCNNPIRFTRISNFAVVIQNITGVLFNN